MKTAGTMFSVWLVILGVLAVLSNESIGGDRKLALGQHAGAVYYVHSQTNTTIQDINGTVSVQVRALRPAGNSPM